MQSLPFPFTRDIVLVGGGHTHALLLRRWGMDPLPGARLTVINPAPTAPYTGMLPGFVAGHYERDDLEIDLVKLARFAGARLVLGAVHGMDRANKLLFIQGRSPIAYDVASFDIGITSDMPEVPGFSKFGCAAKPLGPFALRWQSHLDSGAGPVTVIGGGIAGVELAMAMRHAMPDDTSVTIVEARVALDGIAPASRRRLLTELSAQKIALIEGRTVSEVTNEQVTLDDGHKLQSSLTVGAAGARPFSWLSETGLELDEGYIAVDKYLRSSNDPAIFATGDCAHLSASPRPKAGVFAVRAAPVLTDNLRAAISKGELRAFRPQAHYLKLVSLGRKSALADKWGRALAGEWVWHWKDRIDQAFMAKLNNLPSMPRPALPTRKVDGLEEALGSKPLCGGCGAKVGAATLDDVLSTLSSKKRRDVELGTGDDAAVIRFGDARQVITTDHLRAFWNDPWVFARIAGLHALGDIWAMGANPQAALVQVTLPPLGPELQNRWMSEIMSASEEVFSESGAVIAGGHSSLGAEFSLGFTLTGISTARPVTISGARPGDRLLITRPLGSGILFAGEMEGKAKGDWIGELLTSLVRSQGDAARLLADRAHAMTDITGFGLAGHLSRMAKASGLSAHVSQKDLPVFDGALQLSQAGLQSSIWSANASAHPIEGADTPLGKLMFDPQTAGGLLAALPSNIAQATCNEIRGMGHRAALIGVMKDENSTRLRLVE